MVSPVPGDQGNVVMDFKDSGAVANNLDVISNEFRSAGGVSAMKIGADAAQVGGGAGPVVDFGPAPAQLVDVDARAGFVDARAGFVDTRAGFVDNRGINIAAENSLISNDLGMVNSNFAAHGHGHFGGGNGFDHIDSININIDPSLGLDFGPMAGDSGIASRFNSATGIGQSFDDRVIDNRVAFDNPKLSNFEATSNFVEPAPISLMETSFDNAAMSSNSFSSNIKSGGGNNDNHIMRRTTTVRKLIRKQV